MAEHPSDRRLERWAEGRRTPLTNSHVQHCPQCAQRLEEITALEAGLREHLSHDLAPSDLVAARMAKRLEQAFADRETMSVLIDLVSNGLRTSQVLLEGQREDEDESDG